MMPSTFLAGMVQGMLTKDFFKTSHVSELGIPVTLVTTWLTMSSMS